MQNCVSKLKALFIILGFLLLLFGGVGFVQAVTSKPKTTSIGWRVVAVDKYGNERPLCTISMDDAITPARIISMAMFPQLGQAVLNIEKKVYIGSEDLTEMSFVRWEPYVIWHVTPSTAEPTIEITVTSNLKIEERNEIVDSHSFGRSIGTIRDGTKTDLTDAYLIEYISHAKSLPEGEYTLAPHVVVYFTASYKGVTAKGSAESTLTTKMKIVGGTVTVSGEIGISSSTSGGGGGVKTSVPTEKAMDITGYTTVVELVNAVRLFIIMMIIGFIMIIIGLKQLFIAEICRRI